MATYPAPFKINGRFLTKVFNPKDIKGDSLVVSSILSNAITSGNIAISSSVSGDNSVATKSDLDNLKNQIIDGADSAYNTFREIENELKDNDNAIASIISTINTRATNTALASTNTALDNTNNSVSSLTTRMTAVEFENTSQTSFINQLWNNKQDKSDMTNYYIKSDTDTLLNSKQDKSDMANYYNKSDTNSLLTSKADSSALNNYYLKTETNTLLSDKANTTDLNTSNNRITSLENKATAISFNSATNTTTIDRVGVDTLTIGSNVNFNGSVSGLNKGHVGLNNVDNTSDLNKPVSTATQTALNLKANINNPTFTGSVGGITKNMVGLSNVDNTSDVNKPISTATQSAITLKQDRANSIYSNTYYLNAGVNTLSSVLTSIGSLTSTAINISPSGHSDTQNPVIVSKVNLCLVAPDCAFASPATTFNFPLNVNGSTSTRNLFNNIQFAQNFIIDGTLGRHSFKGCSFLQNFTLQNATTNWIFFYYCSFSGQVTIPSTFAGYIIFYFCDFNGATLNFNNASNQQIYINSCNNLPSFSLNALLSGFNTTTTSSSISSVSLNVSGSVSMPSDSISQSSVNGLSSSLSTINTNITNLQTDNTSNKSNITDLQTDNTSNKSRLTSLENDNNTNKVNITSLQSNKSDISYVDNKVNTAIQSLINSSPSTLDTLNELATALGNDPNFATTITNNLASKANQTDLTTTNNNLSTLSTNLTNNYYDKTSADTLLSGKVDNSTLTSYYTKTATDSLLSEKVDNTTLTSYYTKTATDSLLTSKVDSSTLASYYTKTQTDNKFALQSDLTTANQNIQTNTTSINTINSNLNNYYTKTDSDGKFQTITGMASYLTTSNASSTYQPILSYDTAPTSSSNNIVRSGGIFTALQNYALNSSLSSYLTAVSASSTYQTISGMTSYLTTSTASSTYQTISGMASYLTQTAGDARYQLASAMSSYLTTSTASSTYQTISGMASYFGLSSNNSVSGNNNYTGINNHSRNTESVTQSGSGSNLSLNYNSINAIFYYSPSANYTLTLTNIPTTQNMITSITGVYPTKFFCNAISINGASVTMRAPGGLSNIAVNASATRVVQNFNIFNNAGTFEVRTNVLSDF